MLGFLNEPGNFSSFLSPLNLFSYFKVSYGFRFGQIYFVVFLATIIFHLKFHFFTIKVASLSFSIVNFSSSFYNSLWIIGYFI